MDKKILHFVYIPFTGVGLIGYRGPEWLYDRIEVFEKYTLASLLAQTNKNFVLWCSFRPEERDNYQVRGLSIYLTSIGVNHVFTYDGLMYWDDKFNKGIVSRILNFGRIVRRCWRMRSFSEFIPSIKDLLKDKNGTLKTRVYNSLASLPYNPSRYDVVYLTRVDSDDMLHKDYIKRIQEEPLDGTDAFVCPLGLIHNVETGEVATWEPDTNPPFHTIVFSPYSFFNSDSHVNRYRNYKSHEDVTKVFENIKLMPENSFCVTTHNPKNHISTIWNHPFRGPVVNSDILKDFGIE